MGIYDTLVDDCPKCGETTSQQTKFHEDVSLGIYNPGDKITGIPSHNYSIELSDCYDCGTELFANFRDGEYLGMMILPSYSLLYSDKSRREEIGGIIEKISREYED